MRGAETEGATVITVGSICNCSACANSAGAYTTPSVPALCQHARTQRGDNSGAGLRGSMRHNGEDSSMSKGNETFDALAEVERIRARRAEARRKLYRRSRLDRYRAELVAMKRAGASCADLAEWLRVQHRCKVNRSTIDRYLKKLPELHDTQTVTSEPPEPLSGDER